MDEAGRGAVRGVGHSGAGGGPEQWGGGHGRARKRARAEEEQGLVRVVRVVGLGEVRVRLQVGEVLRLRHVVSGAWGRSVRMRHSRFNARHGYNQTNERGVIAGEEGTGLGRRTADEVRRDAGDGEDSIGEGSCRADAGAGGRQRCGWEKCGGWRGRRWRRGWGGEGM